MRIFFLSSCDSSPLLLRLRLFPPLLNLLLILTVRGQESGSISKLAYARSKSRRLLQRIGWIKPQYTPLVFFTQPKGTSADCDAMERIIRRIEDDLRVHVLRIDVQRHDHAAQAIGACLAMALQSSSASQMLEPPFLYHRESCQVLNIPQSKKSSKSTDNSDNIATTSTTTRTPTRTISIDYDRIKAWAQGRPLTMRWYSSGPQHSSTKTSVSPPIHIMTEEAENDRSSLHHPDDQVLDQLDEELLTPLQRKGKQAIRERTEQKK